MNLAVRIVRALLGAVLFLMLGVLIVLLLFSGLSAVTLCDDAAGKAVGWLTLAATAGIVAAWSFASRRLRKTPWGGLAAAYALVAPVWFYVMEDEAEFKRPLTLAELSPAPPRAGESWLVTLWSVVLAPRRSAGGTDHTRARLPRWAGGRSGRMGGASRKKSRPGAAGLGENGARAGMDRGLRWLARPFFLRRATANAYADCIEDLTRLAEQRQLGQLDARQRAVAGAQVRGRFKNILGGLLLRSTIVRYANVVDNHWKKEDQRRALLAELRHSPP